MVWDLEKDLWKIADSYHRYMVKINDLVLIGFREAQLFPELNDTIVPNS